MAAYGCTAEVGWPFDLRRAGREIGLKALHLFLKPIALRLRGFEIPDAHISGLPHILQFALQPAHLGVTGSKFHLQTASLVGAAF